MLGFFCDGVRDTECFFESFVPNLKIGQTMDPMEKAKAIQAHFKDDPRLGGMMCLKAETGGGLRKIAVRLVNRWTWSQSQTGCLTSRETRLTMELAHPTGSIPVPGARTRTLEGSVATMRLCSGAPDRQNWPRG